MWSWKRLCKAAVAAGALPCALSAVSTRWALSHTKSTATLSWSTFIANGIATLGAAGISERDSAADEAGPMLWTGHPHLPQLLSQPHSPPHTLPQYCRPAALPSLSLTPAVRTLCVGSAASHREANPDGTGTIQTTHAILEELASSAAPWARNQRSRHGASSRNPRRQQEVAQLCERATSSLRQKHTPLSAKGFVQLGLSLKWAVAALAGTSHAAAATHLAEASLEAVVRCRVEGTEISKHWAQFLLTVATAGVPSKPGLLNQLVGHITPSSMYGYGTTSTCGKIAWALGKLGADVSQPDTAAVLRALVQTVADRRGHSSLATRARMLSCLAMCGCSIDPSNPAGAAVDVWPVVVQAVRSLHAATSYTGSKALLASSILLDLAALGCRAAPGRRPDITILSWNLVVHVCGSKTSRAKNTVPDITANLLSALVKSGADHAAAKPALTHLVPLFTSKVQAGQCSTEQIKRVVDVLAHYGEDAGSDRQVLIAALAERTAAGIDLSPRK